MEKLELNDEVLNAQLDRASNRAILADTTEPRAVSAHYDQISNQIVIHLRDGSTEILHQSQ